MYTVELNDQEIRRLLDILENDIRYIAFWHNCPETYSDPVYDKLSALVGGKTSADKYDSIRFTIEDEAYNNARAVEEDDDEDS